MKDITIGVLLAAVVGLTAWAFFQPEQPLAGSAGPDHTEYQRFLAGVSYHNSVATSTTATTQTLGANDIAPRGIPLDHISFTPNTGDLTLTWPASSTLRNFVPRAGDVAHQCFTNASTTAGIDITIAAGTGIDLEVASSTVLESKPVLTVLADSTVCFTYIRKPSTASAFDIKVLMTRFVDGD